MKRIKILVVLLLSILLTTKINSQGKTSIHIGPSIPISDFASVTSSPPNLGSGAAIGLNVGLQYIVRLSEKGIGIFGGIDFNYNGLKKDYKEVFDGPTVLDIKYSKFINVPVTAGLNYIYEAGNKIGVFANAGLALNFLKITDLEIIANTNLGSSTAEYDLAYNVGFKIGGGILINQKMSVSLDYLGLGIHNIDSIIMIDGYQDHYETEVKVDFLTLTVGYNF